MLDSGAMEWAGHIIVYGTAQPQGSKRLIKHRHTGQVLLIDDNKKLKPWRKAVAKVMMTNRPPSPMDCAVSLDVTLYIARPKGHFGTGRNEGKLKPTAPTIAKSGFDTDKILRGLYDAGKGIWWTDDRRIARVSLTRFYDDGRGERVELHAASFLQQRSLFAA